MPHLTTTIPTRDLPNDEAAASPFVMETPSSLPILAEQMEAAEAFFQTNNESSRNPAFNQSEVTTMRPTIIIYPTVPPQTVIIPILCSIIIFPIVAAAAICLLRYYNQRARAKDRFRAGFQQGASAMFAMGKIGATSNVGKKKPDPPKSPVSRFQCMPELELDTVFEAEERYPSEEDESSLQNCVSQLEAEKSKRLSPPKVLAPPTLKEAKKTMKVLTTNDKSLGPEGPQVSVVI